VTARELVDETAVEGAFAARGFDIVHAHELSIERKIELVRSAARIAGPVGSAMYLAAFARPGTDVLVLAPPRFAFADDALIAHFRGTRLSYFFGEERGDGTLEPQYTPWSVDVARLGSAIDEWTRTPSDNRARSGSGR
jgi:capsular polysaccharide biosynthesis protein